MASIIVLAFAFLATVADALLLAYAVPGTGVGALSLAFALSLSILAAVGSTVVVVLFHFCYPTRKIWRE